MHISTFFCILQHPQLSSDICHLLGKVGTEEAVELKGKCFLILNIFFFQKRSPGAFSGALRKYRATKGMQKVSVLAIEEISASFLFPSCQTSNKAHLYHMRLMPKLERKDSLFPKFHSKLISQQNLLQLIQLLADHQNEAVHIKLWTRQSRVFVLFSKSLFSKPFAWDFTAVIFPETYLFMIIYILLQQTILLGALQKSWNQISHLLTFSLWNWLC